MNSEPKPQQDEDASLADLVVNLNFVPAWARDESDNTAEIAGGTRGAREDRVRKRRQTCDRTFRHGRGRRGEGDSAAGRGSRDRREQRESGPDLAALPVRVRFIPERKALGVVARALRVDRRAMPLQKLAMDLLTGEQSCLVKIELPPARPAGEQNTARLFMCLACQQVFREHASAWAHVIGAHLDLHFRREVREGDPPSGQFACVGRCRLSGEWLGPPNHHTYDERLMDLYKRRFSHMSLDEYRQQIEMVRDPARVEEWRQEARKQEVFFPLDEKDGAGEMTRREAERIFAEKYAKPLIRETRHAVIPRRVAMALEDSVLAKAVQAYAERERQRPFSMMMALRVALQHMKFHTFRWLGRVFVTRVEPRPLNPKYAVREIAEVLEFVQKNPGRRRYDVVAQLKPGCSPDSAEVAALLSHLSWLIEKGHIIEFFDGTLAVPEVSNPALDHNGKSAG